jgi:chromate transporter
MQHKANPSFTELFLSFLWIGFTAFGGAAMAVQLRKYVVEKKSWMDGKSFDSGLALCQVIPGAIIMQLAAYIGLKLKGVRGAVVSFIGFGLPAFLLMLMLSVLYKYSKNITTAETILSGLRVIMVAIIGYAAYNFGKKNFRHIPDVIIAITAAGLFMAQIHPALVLIVAALLGIVLSKTEVSPVKNIVRTNTLPFLFWTSALFIVCYGILFLVNKEYFALATIMLHIDLFSFGGGLSAIPIMYQELVVVYHWFDQQTFMDGVIMGQVTPGSIVIAAAFYGYMHFGIFGSILAAVFVFTPSFLILMGIVPFFDKLSEYPKFNKVINAILCSFVGLLCVITYRFAIDIHWNMINIIFTLIAFVLLLRNVNAIWLILVGIVLSFFM